MSLKPSFQEALEETINILASRWDSAGPLLAGFPLLAQGRPVSVEEIASAAGVEISQVEEAVDAARCERDARGRLIDLYGLTLTPTRHQLEIGHKVLFSCCALWAYVVPRLVDATVGVKSVDPLRQELVRLSISPAGLETADPPAAAATLVITSQEAVDRDVCAAWCCQVCYFVSLECAEEFAAERPTCYAVELSEFQQAAEFFHQAIWSAIEA
ncbi:MAG: organomercurial lyase [Thermoanaerobaculia bacterium]